MERWTKWMVAGEGFTAPSGLHSAYTSTEWLRMGEAPCLGSKEWVLRRFLDYNRSGYLKK
jgi:hypothetical protein